MWREAERKYSDKTIAMQRCISKNGSVGFFASHFCADIGHVSRKVSKLNEYKCDFLGIGWGGVGAVSIAQQRIALIKMVGFCVATANCKIKS